MKRDFQSDWHLINDFFAAKGFNVPGNPKAFDSFIAGVFNQAPGLYFEMVEFLDGVNFEIEKMIIENREGVTA